MTNGESCGTSTEVEWPMGDTTVYATELTPSGDGPFAGVAFVAGSGPTDRNWESPLLPGANGSARLLAETIACAGLASIRYDKRASGAHLMDNMPHLIGKLSMASHRDELAGAVRALVASAGVRRDRLFAVANSEGNLHALNYQLDAPEIPFAGLVLVAPPGRSVGDVARSQIAEQFRPLPNGDALLARYDESAGRFVAGEATAPDPSLPEGAQMLLRSLETPANLPFARELWAADAAPLLARVDVPVLVVVGKKDIQVDWRVDGGLLQAAAAGRDNVTFVFPDDANHVLKHEPRPRAELTAADATIRYNAPDSSLDENAVAAIVDWLMTHAEA